MSSVNKPEARIRIYEYPVWEHDYSARTSTRAWGPSGLVHMLLEHPYTSKMSDRLTYACHFHSYACAAKTSRSRSNSSKGASIAPAVEAAVPII